MRQAALKLKMGTAKVASFDHRERTRVLHVIFVLFGIFALAYVFLIGTIIFNIVERKMLEGEARVLASEVGALELSYLSAYQDFDVTSAREYGFVEVKPDFAVRSVFIKDTEVGKHTKVSRNEI